MQAAATITLNSPASLSILHSLSPSLTTNLSPLATAELLREIALKCISFNGIPRTINTLSAFKASLDHHPWSSSLTTTPTRTPTPSNLDAITARGRNLWQSIYTPLDEKLEQKLTDSHPDLPVHILNSHYGPLLADPPEGQQLVGRCLTSVVAVACLRAQTGVGPQVLSHVFGLRKGVEQGAHVQEEDGEGLERLAGDEGCEWLLRSVDAIAEAIGGNVGRWDGELKGKL